MKKYLATSMAIAMVSIASVSQAALNAAEVTALETAVIADVGIAAAAGMAIMTVALGWDVGIGLVKKFTKKGAR